MFSKNFPDVKSPEQMAFEGKVGEIITGDEIDLDDLSAADFITSDEDDDETVMEILDEMDFLGSMSETKKRKVTESEEENDQGRKKKKMEAEASKAKEGNERKRIAKEIGEMDEIDRKAVGAFFLSLKKMRRAAKLNLRALTRLQELAGKYPCLHFLYKIMKPISEIMPENPINTVTPILQMVGVTVAIGGQKYDTENVLKVVPKRLLVDGKIKHKCSACEFERASWGAVNTHIMKEHVGQSYVCSKCSEILTSMDGLCHHMRNQHQNYMRTLHLS